MSRTCGDAAHRGRPRNQRRKERKLLPRQELGPNMFGTGGELVLELEGFHRAFVRYWYRTGSVLVGNGGRDRRPSTGGGFRGAIAPNEKNAGVPRFTVPFTVPLFCGMTHICLRAGIKNGPPVRAGGSFYESSGDASSFSIFVHVSRHFGDVASKDQFLSERKKSGRSSVSSLSGRSGSGILYDLHSRRAHSTA